MSRPLSSHSPLRSPSHRDYLGRSPLISVAFASQRISVCAHLIPLSDIVFCSRFSQVEDRIANLENAPPPQTVALSPAAPTSSALVARNGAIVTDHERRIAALEAQVYALHLSVANPPPPPAHLQAPPNPYFSSQPQYATKTFSHYSGHTATASPPLSKPQFDAASGPCLFANGDAFRQRYPPEGTPAAERQHRDYEHGDYEHRDKRHKAELPVTGELDFIERGVVTEAEASLCFES